MSGKADARRRMDDIESRNTRAGDGIDYRKILAAKFAAQVEAVNRHGGWDTYDPAEMLAVVESHLVDADDELQTRQAEAAELLEGRGYPVQCDTSERRSRHRQMCASAARSAHNRRWMLSAVRDSAAADVAAGRVPVDPPAQTEDGSYFFRRELSGMSVAELVSMHVARSQ